MIGGGAAYRRDQGMRVMDISPVYIMAHSRQMHPVKMDELNLMREAVASG
jgi:hypothetical protein